MRRKNKKGGRPRLSIDEPVARLGIRLPRSLVRRLDAYAEYLQKARPGAKLSRSEAFRTLLVEALDDDATPRHERIEDLLLYRNPTFLEILKKAIACAEGIPIERVPSLLDEKPATRAAHQIPDGTGSTRRGRRRAQVISPRGAPGSVTAGKGR